MYLVQTVTSRPRAWASYTNVNIKDEQRIKSMNSVEEISSYKPIYIETYKDKINKTAATTYDFPDHPPKKDKKWSIGNLFRRKKKDESESSSEDEVQKRNFLNKKKKKGEKRKKSTRPIGTFDHIVIPPNRGSYIIPNGYPLEDSGILSDPSGGFAAYTARPLPKIPDENKELNRNESYRSHHSLGSADSLNKKSRRERVKARAVARRDSFQQGSSSDEDSQRSYSSSRIRSDESLTRQRDGSLSRKSRIARTERYIRRLSKDDETILNREAMQRQAKENLHLKPPTEHSYLSRSPNRSSHSSSPRPVECFRSSSNSSSQPNFSGLFTIPPSHSNHNRYRAPINNSERSYETNCITSPSNCFNLRSLSCEANIHKTPSPENNVMHVQLPLGIPNPRYNQTRIKQAPPPPPPRDPRRMIIIPGDNRPSYCTIQQQHQQQRLIPNISNRYEPNHWNSGFRTASEDHIPTEPKQILAPRPSSVTNETRNHRILNRHTQEAVDKFQYLTEKKPRSRKPIFIQSADKLNYWKSKEETKPLSKSISPQIFTAQTHVQTKIFLPSVLKADIEKSVDTVDHAPPRASSPFKPITSPSPIEKRTDTNSSLDSISNEVEGRRKSTNLEDALDELEAIYKSLHLGDEDLLERAEERERSIQTKKLIESKSESFPIWGVSHGTLSDSSFSYEPFHSIDSPKKKRILKKSHTLDRKGDDMAYRKMNKERSNTINNPQTVIANVSYLLASPVHGLGDEEGEIMANTKEPDVTLDDVVYRNIKHANNSLKVIEPQPPFGIPIGPVAPASNSDYLHAVPENFPDYTFKHKKIPDVVKDDLAFRNLRKDPNKEPALKPVSPVDFETNYNKKKRAVRSLSANISNLMHKENDRNFDGQDNEFKNTSLSDIADAMEIARQILKDKENRISATRRAFLSDSETKYRKATMGSASSTETITESRLNFLNEMRSKDGENKSGYLGDDFLQSKPPKGSSPDRRIVKEVSSTSPECAKKESCASSFEELLTALAVEARETSERITNDLNNLDNDLCTDKDELNKTLSEIDAVSEHAKLCEKLLEAVVESTELIAATKTETPVEEEVEQIDVMIPESVANIVTTRIVDENRTNPVETEVHSSPEHDYENLGSEEEIPLIDESEGDEICKSPFEEHKAELIASFKELSKLDEPEEKSGGEKCVIEENALPSQECAFISETQINISPEITYTTNCDIYINEEQPDSQSSSGFHSNSSSSDSVKDESENKSFSDYNEHIDQIPSLLLESLKSPKLVTSVMKQAEERGVSNSLEKSKSPDNKPSCSNQRHTPEKSRSWYGDPLVLAFACFYGVACSYQLASLDIVAILGLLFVIISIAAALLRE